MEFISDSGPKKPVHMPSGSTVKRAFLHTCAFIALAVPTQAFANPEGGIVTAGSATITENGSTLTIDQSTSRAIIDWRSFNIDPNETTRFNQPSSTSVTLNRVRAADPSYILGTLSANGTVILVNPSGVFFGANAVVDVAGMVATTADIRNENFMAGNYNFDIPGNPNARIVNQGLITAHDAGLVGLVAPNVENSGIISARLGKVSLASGDTFTLDMYGDNLINVAVSDDVAEQIVSNTGTIEAAGGTISMTAAAGRNVVNSLITVAGELKAPTAGVKNGKIVIGAAGANKTSKTGKSKVLVSGRIDTSGKSHGEKGGSVTITGDQVGLLDNAYVDASGAIGGGTVLIGGDYQGGSGVQTAMHAYFSAGAQVDVSAIENGSGGKAILWSDGNTQFYGTIIARGAGAGDGGFVETSGKATLTALGRVHANAEGIGAAGTWLLDPNDILIRDDVGGGPDDTNTIDANGPIFYSADDSSVVTTEAIEAVLNTGTNVTISTQTNGANTQTGTITLTGNINSNTSAGYTDVRLTLNAHDDIVFDGGTITRSGTDKLRVLLNADTDATGGGAITLINGSSITQPATAVTLRTSALNIDNTSSILGSTLQLTNAVAGDTIVIGSGTGTLQISDATLARMTFNNYQIGSATSGDITINTARNFGSSVLTVTSGRDINLAGNLTRSSGTGAVNYTLRANRDIYNSGSAGITSTSGSINLVLQSDYDQAVVAGGGIYLSSGSIITNGGNLTLSGGADIETGYALGHDSFVKGIYLAGMTINAGAGNIIMRGQGIASAASAYGIHLISNTTIDANGAVTLIGQGGGTGTDASGMGIVFQAGSLVKTTGTAALTLTGTGGNIGGSGDTNYGVYFNSSGVQATGSGAIAITGTGGGLGGSGANNYGVFIFSNGTVTGNGGAITITGTGGANTGTNSYGFANNGVIINANGNISLTGIGGTSSGSSAIGVRMGSGTIDAGNGTIFLSGTGGQSSAPDYNVTGGTLTAGAINIIGDSFTWNTATATATDTITIANRTAGKTMTIGQASGSDINLSNTFMGLFTAGTYIFGSTTSGDITIDTTKDFADKNITFISGNDINLAGTMTKATGTGTANYVLTAKGNIYNTNSAGITRSAGALNIVMNADSDGNSDGAISLTSAALTTNGGYIVLGGGAGTLGGTNGILGDGDGTGADDTAAWGNATYNAGITLTTTNMTTSGGSVFIKGRGLNGGATANRGMLITGGTINTAAGNITLHGTAGSGSNKNQGIDTTTSAAFTTTDGTITITGIGNGTGGNSAGIYLHGGTNISATNNGNVNIYGTGKTSGGSGGDDGIALSNANITIKNGTLLLHGTGGTSNGGSDGIDISSASVLSTGTGSLTLTGIAANVTSFDLNVSGTTNMGGASHTGNIIFNTNKLTLTALSLQTTGKLTIAPRTAATTVGIGPVSGSVLNISDAYMAMFNAGSFEFGAANSGLLTISTAYDFGNKSVSFISGADISMASTLTRTGNGATSLSAFRNISTSAAITTQNGALTLRSNNTGAGSGYINAGGAINTNGGDIIMGGGSGAITGAVLNPDGSIAVAATGFAMGNADQVWGVNIGNHAISAGSGNIIINGQGYNTTTDINTGVRSSGQISATGANAININGIGGGLSGNSGSNIGVSIYTGNGRITHSGSGSVIVTGTGGGAGSGTSNYGISIGTGGITSNSTGAIYLVGQGGTTVANTSNTNTGVLLYALNAASTGTITVRGTGGNGTASGGNNAGIDISGTASGHGGTMTFIGLAGQAGRGMSISANVTNTSGAMTFNGTGTGTGSGSSSGILVTGASGAITNTGTTSADTITITANGTSNGSNSTSNMGLSVANGASISTTGGNLTVTATAGNGAGVGASNHGINIAGTNSTIKTLGAGNLILTGTGGGASATTPNHGINSAVENGIQTTGSGSIILTGTAGIGAGSAGIATSVANGINTTGTGNITLLSDSFVLTIANAVNSAGILTIAPKTNGTMAIGTTGSTLNFSTDNFGYITGASYVFGSNTSGLVTINTTNDFGDKSVSFISGTDINIAGNLTKATGTGTANYLLQSNGSIYNSSNAGISATTGKINLILNADYDQGTSLGGAIALTGGSFLSNGGDITLSGGSNIATGYAYGTSTYIRGILLDGATVDSGTGALIARGHGYDSGSASGIQLTNGGKLKSASTLTVNGVGGGSGTGTDNYGIHITNLNSTIQTSGSGLLSATGTGGNQTGSGSTNVGIVTNIANAFQATGSGAITLTGHGGTQGGGSAGNNYGITIAGGIAANGGLITVNGTGGGTTGSNNYGIYISGNITNANGGIILNATGGGTGASNVNSGLRMSGGTIDGGSGTITVNAIGGTGASTTSFNVNGGAIGTGTTTGAINMIGDSYSWSVGTVTTSGTATFSNRTAGKTISIGSTSGYDINISNAMLDLFTAGTYTFGSMSSGNLVVNTTKDFVDRNLSFLSGTSITMVGNLTKATGTGTANYLLQANNGIFVNNSVSIQPTTGKINITLNSDYDQATVAGGRMTFGTNSAVKSGGGDIVMGGGLNPLVGYATGIDAAGILTNVATVIDAGTGNITIRGATTGSASTQGLTLFATSIKTTSGNITLDGTTNSSGNAAHGIAFNGVSGASGIETTSGLISLKSRNLNTGNTSNVGLVMWVDSYIRSLGSGSITLDLQSSGIDFHGNTGTVSTIGGAAMTGDITINASDANAWASGVAITTQGKLTWAAASGESLGIGNSAAGTTGKLTEAQLNTMTAGTYQFGDANTSSLVVNTTKDFGDKSVTFVSGNDINIAGTLTKATGAGTASYIFYANRDIYSSNSAAMTASSGAINIVLNADRNANQDGAIRLNSSNVTTNGGYLVMGGGAGTLGGTNGILGDGDGTGADDVGAWGNGTYRQGTAIVGGLINTGAGNMYISGHGVNSAGLDGNRGVLISAGGRLQTSSGIITIKGTGGNGDDSNVGIYATGTGTGITSDTGAINLTGFGGSDGGTDSDQNNGVRIDGGAVVSSTGTTSSAATITIIGTSTNSDDYNDGVSLADANTKVTSVRGAITITGTGGSNGLAGSLSNHGVAIIDGAAVESTGVAPISITGIGAHNGSDIYTAGTGTNTIGGTTAAGNIIINANTADLTALSAQTTGIITIANRTAGTTIAVGPAATATLNLTTDILNMLNGGSYVFGSNNSGAITINTTRDFADKSVTFISGNDISLAGTLTKASGSGTASYLFQANRNISNTGSAGISATSGTINLTMNSDADYATSAGGTLTLTDANLLANGGTIALNSNGNALSLAGSTVIGGDAILNSSNADVSIATLNGDTAGARSLTINNGTGTFTTTGIIGGTQKLKDFSINADDVVLGNDIYGEGILSIAPTTNSRPVVINFSPGGGELNLTQTEVGYIKDGWSQINIGKASGSTSYMDIGATTWNDPVSFRGWYTRVRGNIAGMGNATVSFIGSGAELDGSSTVSTQGRDITFLNGFSQYTANNTINSNGGNIIISRGISSNIASGGTTNILSGNGNITIGNGTTSIAAGLMTTGAYVLNAGTGTLTFSGAVDTPVALTATAGSLVFSGAWGTTTPLGAVSLTSGTSVTLPTIRAATIFAQTTGTGANITIPVTHSLTTTGSGNAITLVAKNNFINQSATPFVMSNGGRYLVYSTNTTDTQLNGLASSFVRYSCTYGGTCPTFASETGNGLLYTFTPVLTVTPNAVAAITYGSAAPNLAGYTYGLTGWLSGADQSASIVTGTLNGATNYTQGANVGSYAVNYSAGTLAETLGYGFTYANNSTGLTVNTRLLTVSLAGSVDRVYDGTNTATLASGNYTLGNIYNSESLSISNTSGTYSDKNVGTGKAVTVNGLTLTGTTAGNYTLASSTVTGNVGNITKRDITVGGIGIAGKTYDGNDVAAITGTAALSNTILNDDILLGGTASAHFINANAGISKSVTVGGYTVSGNDAGNYNFAQPTGLVATIAKKDVTITAANQSIVYGDTLPGTTLSYNGFISGEDHNVLDASPSIASAQSGLVNAGLYIGNYTVNGGTDNNYNLLYVAGDLNVAQKNLIVTAANETVVYGTAVPTTSFAYNGFISGQNSGVLDTAPTLASAQSGIVNAGTYAGNYTVGGGSDNNYSFTYVAGNLTVTKKTLNVTADNKTVTYGVTVPAGTYTYNGFIDGEDAGVLDTAPLISSAQSGIVDTGSYAGNFTVGSGVDNNYAFNYVAGNLNVSPAALHVTADNKTITYGDAITAGTYVITGYVNGDDVNALTSLPTISSLNSGLTNAGTYTGNYVVAGGSASNYTFDYVNGTLTIGKKTLAVQAGNQSIEYGQSIPTASISYTGFITGQDADNLNTAPHMTSNQSGIVNAGTYTNNFMAAGGVDNNYSFDYIGGNLVVTKKLLTVTTGNQTVTYGTTVPTGTLTYNGFITGDHAGMLDTAPTISSVHSGIVDVGTYNGNYSVGGGVDNNYSFAYAGGNLAVTKKNLVATANSYSVLYGNAVPVGQIIYSGFENGEGEGVLDTAPVLASAHTGVMNPGNYYGNYTVGGGVDNNYSFTYVAGNFTVTGEIPPPTILPSTTETGRLPQSRETIIDLGYQPVVTTNIQDTANTFISIDPGFATTLGLDCGLAGVSCGTPVPSEDQDDLSSIDLDTITWN